MRTRPQDVEKRTLSVLLYTMCKASYNFLGTKLFKVSPTTVINWIKKEAKKVENSQLFMRKNFVKFCIHNLNFLLICNMEGLDI